MNNPIDIPFILPINASPMFGQMGMEQLHVLGLLLVVGFVVACSVIGWKILHSSSRRANEDHVVVDRPDRRPLDQAAPGEDAFAA
jgi:hypothetical protein